MSGNYKIGEPSAATVNCSEDLPLWKEVIYSLNGNVSKIRALYCGKATNFTNLFHHSTFIYWAYVVSSVLWWMDDIELGGIVIQ